MLRLTHAATTLLARSVSQYASVVRQLTEHVESNKALSPHIPH
jgi:hypothetical protein